MTLLKTSEPVARQRLNLPHDRNVKHTTSLPNSSRLRRVSRRGARQRGHRCLQEERTRELSKSSHHCPRPERNQNVVLLGNLCPHLLTPQQNLRVGRVAQHGGAWWGLWGSRRRSSLPLGRNSTMASSLERPGRSRTTTRSRSISSQATGGRHPCRGAEDGVRRRLNSFLG